MTKCVNGCGDFAEQNITWPTSRGVMSANLCGVCSTTLWAKFKSTPAFQSAIIGPVKSQKELSLACKEYEEV